MKTTPRTIAIIGAGMMGSALSIPACDKGHSVRLVGTPLDVAIIDHARQYSRHVTMDRALPQELEYYQFEQLDAALPGCDFVICGVSSFGVDWFLQQVMARLPQGMPVLAVTKGLVDLGDGTLEPYPHYWRRLGGGHLILCGVGGPCTSYELADRRHSAVAFCGSDLPTLQMLRQAMQTDYYHISLSHDVIGVESAVALKNAYALAVTLAVGLTEKTDGPGCTPAYNPQAALFGQSVREMAALLKLLGGGAENIVLGAGDLYVTVFGGRTRKLGALLGQGLSIDEALARLQGVTLESVVITRRMIAALKTRQTQGTAHLQDYPLLHHVSRLLDGETGIDIPWKAFTTQP